MFLTLLAVTFLVASIVSFIVAKVFDRPLRQILVRLVTDDLSAAWHRYLLFAICVVGISGGVRIWNLERYINPGTGPDSPPLVFFGFALVAYVVVRGLEAKRHP